MKLTDIVDPVSGNKLFSLPISSEILNNKVTAILVTEDRSRYYFEFEGVVYLVQPFDSYLDCNEFDTTNIPHIIDEEALSWYTDYTKNLGSFKYVKFSQFFDEEYHHNMKVLDLISADGNLIDVLSDRAKNTGRNVTFYALDLDFYALKILKSKHPEVVCVCAEATKKAFGESTFDLVFSNSLQHVPESTEAVFANVEEMLNSQGSFLGVETQGFISQLIVVFLSLLPKSFVPNSLSEIYNERKLLRSWLSQTLEIRCKSIAGFRVVKRTLFHCFYQIKKKS